VRAGQTNRARDSLFLSTLQESCKVFVRKRSESCKVFVMGMLPKRKAGLGGLSRVEGAAFPIADVARFFQASERDLSISPYARVPTTSSYILQTQAYSALRRFTSAVSFGRIANTSPTTPKSATEKIGACSSLLMATMYLEPFIPARC